MGSVADVRSNAWRHRPAIHDAAAYDAQRWAVEHHTPLVGNGDVHRLWQLGTTYSLVDASPDPDAICAAIAAGRVRVHSRPLTWLEAGRTLGAMWMSDIAPRRKTNTRETRANPNPAI